MAHEINFGRGIGILHERTNSTTNEDVDTNCTNSTEIPPLCENKNHQEQAQILCLSISLISDLATIDSHDVDGTQMHAKANIQAEIDKLQKNWRLEDTALPSLVASIHRLQSNLSNLQDESTNLTSQIRSADNEVHTTRAQNLKLKKACRKLFHQNKKLSEKLKKKKRDNRHFVKTVREFLFKKRQEELDTEEFLVACHEAMLKKSHGYTISNYDKPTGNRPRTSTSESANSDFDYYSYSGDYSMFEDSDVESSRVVDIGTLDGNGTSLDNSLADYECDASVDTLTSTSYAPMHSASTTRLTDPASDDDTIHVHNIDDNNNPNIDGKHVDKKTSTRHSNLSFKSQSQSYTLSFPPSNDIGLQFVEVPSTISSHHLQSTGSFGSNRRRAYSDGATLNLGIVHEGAEIMSTNKIDEISTCTQRSTSKISPRCQNEERPFTMETTFGTKITKLGKESASDVVRVNGSKRVGQSNSCSFLNVHSMILVRDLDGFDTSLNVRPTIGARLIAMNDQSLLDGHFPLAKVSEYLDKCKLEKSGEQNRSIKLTFRNDPLSKSQKKLLTASADTGNVTGDDAGTLKIPVSVMPSLKSALSGNKGFRMPKMMENENKPTISSLFKFGMSDELRSGKKEKSVFSFMSKKSSCTFSKEKRIDNKNSNDLHGSGLTVSSIAREEITSLPSEEDTKKVEDKTCDEIEQSPSQTGFNAKLISLF